MELRSAAAKAEVDAKETELAETRAELKTLYEKEAAATAAASAHAKELAAVTAEANRLKGQAAGLEKTAKKEKNARKELEGQVRV